MKKLFFLLLVLSCLQTFSQTVYIPPTDAAADSIIVPSNVAGAVRKVYNIDLSRKKVDKTKHSTDSAAMKALIDANTTSIAGKQEALVSGTSIKTINGSSILGSGDLTVSGGGGGSGTTITTTTRITPGKSVITDSATAPSVFASGGLMVGDDSVTNLANVDSFLLYDNSWGTTGGGWSTTGYAVMLAGALRSTLVDSARSGSTLYNNGSGNSFMERIAGIPRYSSNYRAFIIGYGVNDAGTTTAAIFGAQYKQILDTIIINRGWPASKIVLLGQGFRQSTANPTLKIFVDTVASIAQQKGTQFVDIYNYSRVNGGYANVHTDSLHPSALGHTHIMEAILYKMQRSGAAKVAGQLRVDGDFVPGANSKYFGDINMGSSSYNVGQAGRDLRSIFLIDGGTASTKAVFAHKASTGATYWGGRNGFSTILGTGDPAGTFNTVAYIDALNQWNVPAVQFWGAQGHRVGTTGSDNHLEITKVNAAAHDNRVDIHANYSDAAASLSVSNSASAGGTIQKIPATYTPYKTLAASDFVIYNGIFALTGNISVLNDNTTGNINFAAGGSSTAHMTILPAGNVVYPSTIVAAGTTGAQTINKQTGIVNFAAGATTLVVTNSLMLSTSLVFVQVLGTDATAKSARVTRATGSFTITLNAAATAETAVEFHVVN
jgi:hypothetical protein